VDSGAPDADVTELDPIPLGPFDMLSESGLYAAIAAKTIRSDIQEFEPEFVLWTDRAAKTRWIWLPPGSQISSANMGRWVMPIGATAWKEFRDPDSGKRLETRIVQRLANDPGNGSPRFYLASFIWNGDDSEAFLDTTSAGNLDIPAGCASCSSPPCAAFPDDCHVVPRSNQCESCHGGEPYRLLGFSAVQLSHNGPGVTLADLAGQGRLSAPPPAGTTYPVPGTAVERAAIGYLHANCGHCHYAAANQQVCFSLTDDNNGVGMAARVLPGDTTVQDTAIWTSAVDVPLDYWVGPMQENHTEADTGELITTRIVPGDPSRSAVWYRMSVREWGQAPPYNDHQQMPTLGTHEVDATGLGRVATWIQSQSSAISSSRMPSR
jgi:hypothetical protein